MKDNEQSHADRRLHEVMPINRRRTLERADLDFPPIPNGVDYLRSVIDHLDESTGVELRDIKYAVLHLQAAAEVLLKARLFREHWSLVFKDPGKATTKALGDSSFDSCSTIAAVERLRNIARISVSDQDVKALKDLADDRNALQHFGLTHNARAIEARAASALDFLVRFLDEELLPELTAEELHEIAANMDQVRTGLTVIQSFVTRRMNRLRGTVLKGKRALTIRCPACQQMALALVPGGGTCHFCGETWSPDDWLAGDYLTYLGSVYERGQRCPQCDWLDLVEGVVLAADGPEAADTLFCFNCTARYTVGELISCAACSRPWPIEADVESSAAALCPDCRDQSDPENIA
ncbi:hypothetical protein AB0I94_36095 [Streptomyces sp. NPDC050147]|uniref:hypothetical protein n=1 Tax=Streptomyces sp. NPDC050147 TaxID=3155513 RepID=UPI00342673AA